MINVVGIVGGGIMGAGIAEVTARSGCDVVLREVNEAAVEGAQARLQASLDRAVRNGKLPQDERNSIVDRIRFTEALDDLSECDLVAEAAVEDEETKTAIFAALGKVVRPDALLTSNTSSIPIMKLAAVTPSPERVIGMHFFNPATVLPLVEIIPCELTSDDTVHRVQEFAHDKLGKTIVLARTAPGSSSTRCSFPISWPPFGWSTPDWPRPKMSTPQWSRAAHTRWARWHSPI
jgi:3-hydroxybutyryl-CoA dehydrogenase